MNESIAIAVGFDGVCVTHNYPYMGINIGAQDVLKRLVENGHRVILDTLRSGKKLDEAVKWFNDNNIMLYGINENPNQKQWSSSPKVYAHIYINVDGVGCPVIHPPSPQKPYVDWQEVEEILYLKGLL